MQPSAEQPERDEGTSAAPEPWAELSQCKQDPPAVRETSAVAGGGQDNPPVQFGTTQSEGELLMHQQERSWSLKHHWDNVTEI